MEVAGASSKNEGKKRVGKKKRFQRSLFKGGLDNLELKEGLALSAAGLCGSGKKKRREEKNEGMSKFQPKAIENIEKKKDHPSRETRPLERKD